MNCNKKDLLLYAVTDRSWTAGRTLYEQTEEALKGGVTCLQFREKNLKGAELAEQAGQIQKLCARYRVPFIVNDNAQLAYAIDADGVHLGQEDMSVPEARKLLGQHKIIGVSARTVDQALLAFEQGADYLGAGAVFATGTKKDTVPLSILQLKEICSAVSIPCVAIGGISKNNIRQLSGSGISGIAAISAIFAQTDIQKAAEELREEAEKIIWGSFSGNL